MIKWIPIIHLYHGSLSATPLKAHRAKPE